MMLYAITLALMAAVTTYGQGNCPNKESVTDYTIEVSGPYGSDREQELYSENPGLFPRVWVDGNTVAFTFDPPSYIGWIRMSTKLAYEIIVSVYNNRGQLIGSFAREPPNPSLQQFEKSEIFLDGTEQVGNVRAAFLSDTSEWDVQFFRFFTCIPSPPDTPPPNTPPPPPPVEEDDCVCRLRGDPIAENCMGELWFTSVGVFNFSISEVLGCEYKCTFKNVDNGNGVVWTYYMKIEYEDDVIIIYRNHTVSVNGDPPEDVDDLDPLGSGATITNAGDYILVTLPCGPSFEFWGQDNMTRGRANIPGTYVAESTGLCNETP